MDEQALEGGCQCGAVRYRVTGDPVITAFCHCTTCRRATGAPVVAWALYPDTAVRFLNGPPATYASSPGVTRSFCGACGTPIAFAAEYVDGMIDITIGSLDQPDRLAPAFHTWDAERLPWLHVTDDLPRHAGFPPFE